MTQERITGEGRVVFAFFALPLVVAVVGFVLYPIIDLTGRPLYGRVASDQLAAAVAVGLSAGLLAVFVVAFVALPLYLWLQKRAGVTFGNTLISGAILGNVPGVLIVTALLVRSFMSGEWPERGLTYGPAGALRAGMLGTVIGTASAAVFWWMAGLGRPRMTA